MATIFIALKSGQELFVSSNLRAAKDKARAFDAPCVLEAQVSWSGSALATDILRFHFYSSTIGRFEAYDASYVYRNMRYFRARLK